MVDAREPTDSQTQQPKTFMDRYRGILIAIAVVGLLVFLMIFNSL